METLTPSDFYLNPRNGKTIDARSFQTALNFVSAMRRTAAANGRVMSANAIGNESIAGSIKDRPKINVGGER